MFRRSRGRRRRSDPRHMRDGLHRQDARHAPTGRRTAGNRRPRSRLRERHGGRSAALPVYVKRQREHVVGHSAPALDVRGLARDDGGALDRSIDARQLEQHSRAAWVRGR